MKYEEFRLRIRGGQGGSHEVDADSPAGEGHGILRIAAPPENAGPSAQPPAEGRRDLRRRIAALPPEEELARRGAELFRLLFADELGRLFYSSLGQLRGDDEGLRIRLEIDPAAVGARGVEALPWELLALPENGDFLALSRRTPVVRHLRVPRERRPPPRPRRLRVLAFGENLPGQARLDLDRERANLLSAWRAKRSEVEVDFRPGADLAALRREFLARPVHVLIFMGHGGIDGERGRGLLFLRDGGEEQGITGADLLGEIRDFPSLALVVLNACHSAGGAEPDAAEGFADVASVLVRGGVPAVVAMRGPISDPAALAFSQTFFTQVAAGETVDASLAEARNAIRRVEREAGEWALPALFLRHADGQLFRSRAAERRRRLFLAALLLLALAAGAFFGHGYWRVRRLAQAARCNEQGLVRLGEGQVEEARRLFEQGSELDPTSPELLNNLSMAEERGGDLAAATLHAERAARLSEGGAGSATYHFNLGALLRLQGRETEALAALEEARRREDLAEVYNEMGNAYLALQRFADARGILDEGLRRHPDVAPLLKNRARVEIEAPGGDLIASAAWLERAESLYAPGDWRGRAEAAFLAARVARSLEKPREACAALVRFYQAAPHHLGERDPEAGDLGAELGCPGLATAEPAP